MRRKDIDGISGLMIVYMIFVHIVNFTHTGNFFVVLMRPLFFFMPWFFFKSGMFFFHKSNNQMFLEGKVGNFVFLWRNFLGKIYIVSVLSDIERRGCYG